MSVLAEPPPHLTQEELSSKDQRILAGFADWLMYAQFDPKIKKCTDGNLPKEWKRLKEMDFVRKVTPTLVFQDCQIQYH